MAEGADNWLVPGVYVGERYRLLVAHGGRPLLRFWQAVDTVTGYEVGLVLVDPGGELPEEFVHEILARTIRLRGIGTAGVARVLDVLHTGRYGVVVTEWIRGGSLHEIAATAPSPAGVVGTVESLAAAVDAAHRAGLVLSLDDASRLRVSADGHLALAFPATMPEATVQSDLRGIGCALYALLVNRWPTSDQPTDPSAVNPEIPFLISTTVAALLRDQGGIASTATLLTLLRQAAQEADENANCRIMPFLPPPPPGCYAAFRNFGPAEQRDRARRSIIRASLGTAAAVVLVAVLALASSLNGFLDANDDTVAMDADQLGLLPAAPTPSPPPSSDVTEADDVVTSRVQPVAAAVFSPEGSPDSPESAGLAIDGKPDTAWSTDRYYDADPFPAFKPGVGLLVQLRDPTPLSAVTVDLDSSGTVVQVRGVEKAEPQTLTDTTELSPPTPLQPGHNRIPTGNSPPVSQVLVWISTLGSSDGQNRAALSEISLHASSPPA